MSCSARRDLADLRYTSRTRSRLETELQEKWENPKENRENQPARALQSRRLAELSCPAFSAQDPILVRSDLLRLRWGLQRDWDGSHYRALVLYFLALLRSVVSVHIISSLTCVLSCRSCPRGIPVNRRRSCCCCDDRVVVGPFDAVLFCGPVLYGFRSQLCANLSLFLTFVQIVRDFAIVMLSSSESARPRRKVWALSSWLSSWFVCLLKDIGSFWRWPICIYIRDQYGERLRLEHDSEIMEMQILNEVEKWMNFNPGWLFCRPQKW